MKIILSPSKTQTDERIVDQPIKEPKYQNKADQLAEIITKKSEDELALIMKLKGKLFAETFQRYQKYKADDCNHAIASYTGTVFKEIDIKNYNTEEINYLREHLIILSALYGPLRPMDGIKPYRLDMKMKIMDQSLYEYWTETITSVFDDKECIINLASGEFSKLVKKPMITIEFKESKEDGSYKTVGTYAKKARGMMVNYIIKNQIEDIEEIKAFNLEGYSFNQTISKDSIWIFTR